MPPRTRTAPSTEPADAQTPEATAPDQDASPIDETEGGYVRNAGGVDLTVLAVPPRVLGPGRIARFESAPRHRDLAPAAEAEYAAQAAADETALQAADAAPAPTETEA